EVRHARVHEAARRRRHDADLARRLDARGTRTREAQRGTHQRAHRAVRVSRRHVLEHLGRNRDVDAADGDVHPSIVTRHHADLCPVLLGNADLTVTGAMMSNRAASLGIEDHAIMLMQGAGQAAWWRPAISTRRSTRYSTCTTAFAPRGTSRRATTRRSRSSPT